MSSSSKKYDVFLSFRGEDTRTGFTSHLHRALDQRKIETYIDYNINKGEEVWPELAQAIKDSHISIVVFSENYASSKWYLRELVQIMECRKDQGQVVLPVFYKTDPSHVRKQTAGSTYEQAFVKHERDLRNDVSFKDVAAVKLSEWKVTLTSAANISGWHSGNYRDDAELIQELVKDIEKTLYQRYPNELEGIIENNKACREIESLVEKFPAVGIWGMGGIGKTTIAKIMFAKHFNQYDSSCFLANVREEYDKLPQTNLLVKLLSDLLNEQIHSSDVVKSSYIKERIRRLKIFLVLDDVSNVGHLAYLLGELGDLNPHSRLIITTRNKETLGDCKVYELKKWETQESLNLFSLNAFKKEHPEKGYKHLSESVVKYAGGVPLALTVLGLHLRGKSHGFWEDALSKLEEYPHDEIQSVLKVSYDGLNHLEKEIFLDIAFFFKGEDKDHAISMLSASGFYAAYGITILVNKALITISHNNKIQMHDLLQQMGLEIVREQCEHPGGRSRLREIKYVYDVLKYAKGTDRVQGITLDLTEKDDLHLSANAFKKMGSLRFLRFRYSLGTRSSNVSHCGVLNSFSDKLRYFEWHGYPLKALPPEFCAKLLVEIHIPYSDVEKLWEGKQDLVNLEVIDLNECKQLMKLPDLSGASKLKWLYLSGCESLCVVHQSVLSLDTLVTLMLDRCKELKSLISEKHLPSLEKISVNGCSSLKEFSISSDLIRRLDLTNTGIEKLYSSIGHVCKLEWLNLEGLRLKNLPNELSWLKSLQELRISNCNEAINKQKLHVLCAGLRSLKILHLKDCHNLSELPHNIGVLSQLCELRLDGSGLDKLPASIKHLQELEILSLENCSKLRYLPELPPFIKEFCAENCTSLLSLSTLMSFAAKMKGKKKYISFKNCTKLSEESLQCIVEGAHLTMMSDAFHSVSVRVYSWDAHCYNYNRVEVCLAGSRVPREFRYQTTESSSITIQLPARCNCLGFIYCVVLSPSGGKEKSNAKIQCQCYSVGGEMVGCSRTWHDNAISDLNSDHVYAWYDAFHCDSILRSHENQVCFQFCAATDNGDKRDGMISIIECRVRVICVSELDNCLRDQELKKELKLGLGMKLGLVSDIMQRYAEIESRFLVAQEEDGFTVDKSLILEYMARRRAMLTLLKGKLGNADTQSRRGH